MTPESYFIFRDPSTHDLFIVKKHLLHGGEIGGELGNGGETRTHLVSRVW
jgi:hypothetical protein